MSKHTTPPVNKTGLNSHTCNHVAYPIGNWNRHKKRRHALSRGRTPGRLARFLIRAGHNPAAAQRIAAEMCAVKGH